MTRLQPTGGHPDEFEALDNDPRRLAEDVPRRGAGQQRFDPPEGDSVDEHGEGVPTRPARDYS